MKVVEQFIRSKTGDMGTCEDGFVVTDHFAAIIDGATNKSDMHYQGETPGRIAAKLCTDAVRHFPPNTTAHTAYSILNEAIHAFYQAQNVMDQVRQMPTARCTASSVIYSAQRHELWFLGDCMALAGGVSYQFHKELDDVLSNLRSLLIHVELSRGATVEDLLTNDIARKRIVEFLQLQAELQNSSYECEYTYHVLDGIAMDVPNHVQVVKLDKAVREIVLSSDGYPTLHPSLEATELELAETILNDPLCYTRYKSTKGVVEGNVSFDDRTYLRFLA